MRRMVWAGASLMALAACSGSSDPVGENSAGSIRTTAVGKVVAAIPSPTPTPTPDPLANDTLGVDPSANAASGAYNMVAE